MKITVNDPPREYVAGATQVCFRDCGRIALEADEQVTFVTDAGAEYDVVRKSWGFYATPSTNRRLAHFGLRAALLKGPTGKFFVVLIEKGRESEFAAYRDAEGFIVVSWLDDEEALARLERGAGAGGAR